MEQERKIRVAITQGDTNGVGYEVILKAFADPAMFELCTPIVYGSPKIAAYHRKALELETNFSIINSAEEARDGRLNLLTCFDDEVKVELGQPSQEAGQAALMALDRAMTDFRSGLYDVLVTAPINKATIQSPGFKFPGHTEYIETSVGEGKKALMILMNENLRVALVTTHLPIKNVAQAIWDSWVPVVGRYQADVSKMGWGVFALTWSPEMIFPSHFSTSLMGDASPAVWRIPLVLLNLLAGYYLVTRLNAVDMGLYRPKTMNHVMMSNVALIQFVAMLPMFTVLSCDWGRTIPYWVISSLMFYYVFRQEPTTFASPLTSMSSRIQEKISKSKVLSSPYTYILLVLLAPVPTYNAPLDHVNTFQQRFFTIILDMFNQLASLFS